MELIQEQDEKEAEPESHPDIEEKLRELESKQAEKRSLYDKEREKEKLRELESKQAEKRSLYDKEREKHKKPALKLPTLNMPDPAQESRLKTAAYVLAFLAIAIPLWLMVWTWM